MRISRLPDNPITNCLCVYIRNQQIVDNKQQDGSVADAIEYFDQTATLLDKLRAVQKQLRQYIR